MAKSIFLLGSPFKLLQNIFLGFAIQSIFGVRFKFQLLSKSMGITKTELTLKENISLATGFEIII